MESNISLAKTVLKYTYGLVPIVAGLDKFVNLLTEWGKYVSEGFLSALSLQAATFMMIVGIIEVVAGILVLVKPKIGGLVVMFWLIAIALTLIFSGSFLDVAVRDLVMAVGAFVLVKLYADKTV
ncbi:hypothetical protein [uncultured Allomuricauda sp.]|uniref:hypothetical protein n=1 Tax=Flagellimonas sp. W118 TaxID=3410791 RepID=UPI0026356C30|nr:hypothetical protein [uncultured Allomuricauda sp.]